MIIPTVGRVVWFYPAGHCDGEQPLAAIIAHVWSDTCVNLAIFGQDGSPVLNPPTSIQLLQEGDVPPSGGRYCAWMPYQVGQAKAAERPQVHNPPHVPGHRPVA